MDETNNIKEVFLAFIRLKNLDADIKYDYKIHQFIVTWNTTFMMPDDEGGWYWETEVSGRNHYDWKNLEDIIEWILSQEKNEI